MIPLPPKKRSELRAEAHKLNPVVIIGDKGLTDEVLAEVDRSLRAHELVKVRAATAEREARDAWLQAICERLEAHPVQTYFTSTISNSFTPPGACTSATSPEYLPISAARSAS
jgi:putative YhbY family RNA-binding protein